MVKACTLSLGLALLVLSGCGGGGSAPPSPAPTEMPAALGSIDEVKQLLQGVSETGNLGSGVAAIEDAIKKTGKADLLKDFEAIKNAEANPEAVKQLAKQMISKL